MIHRYPHHVAKTNLSKAITKVKHPLLTSYGLTGVAVGFFGTALSVLACVCARRVFHWFGSANLRPVWLGGRSRSPPPQQDRRSAARRIYAQDDSEEDGDDDIYGGSWTHQDGTDDEDSSKMQPKQMTVEVDIHEEQTATPTDPDDNEADLDHEYDESAL